jgi:hypothetical protein
MLNRRLLIEYLLMVGLPLVLLVGVLHQGRTLQAPAAVEGTWKFTLNGSAATGGSCDPLLRDVSGFALSVSQSGSYLTATVVDSGRRVLRGRSEGSDFWLESVRLNGPNPNSNLLRLTGTVRNAQDGKLIWGALLMPRNMDCPPVAFAARLQSGQEPQQRPAER